MHYFQEGEIEKAFEKVKQIDLEKLNSIECIPILQILDQKEAWDLEIIILEKLLQKKEQGREGFYIALRLFNANMNLNRYKEAIILGEELLDQNSTKNYLDVKNSDSLLNNTIFACIERGKIDEEILIHAKKIVEKFKPSNPTLEYKAGTEFEIYLKNNEFDKALKMIIEGVEIKKTLSAQEYAKLNIQFLKLPSRIIPNFLSSEEIFENSFIKFEKDDQWYFFGKDNELDAIKISKSDSRYILFSSTKRGESIVIPNKYGQDIHLGRIENIFTLEQYIYWKSNFHFQALAQRGDLKGINTIQVQEENEKFNPDNLTRFLEDETRRSEPLFDLYCKNNIPLAILAKVEGDLPHALEKISLEEKGFVNFSSGIREEISQQLKIAKHVVIESKPFYLDGTAAFVLIESGLIQKTYTKLENMMVPQSVLTFLGNVLDRISSFPGSTGRMGFAKGRIYVSRRNEEEEKIYLDSFRYGTKLLEANPQNIVFISNANKLNCFSEQKILSEMSDACILAQKEKCPVLTDDPLYLQMNSFETKKVVPQYFSSWALIRLFYEMNIVDFNEYLHFFNLLAFYRYRFLPISIADLHKTIFGDMKLNICEPKNIRLLNLRLTLSTEYGVNS